jgi:RNA polymerase sigma factor (sigma-70 family)
MTSATRASLLEHLRDGTDPLAWDEFFHRYWPLLYGLAKRRGCSDPSAEEIVQDVMLKVFQQRDVFRYDPGRGRFRDWLGAVVRNKVAQRRRRPSDRQRPVDGEGGLPFEPQAAEPEVDAACEAAFEQALLMALLDAVRRETPPEYYLAFELFVLEELPWQIVSRSTGLSRYAIYRARKRVLARLGQLAGTYRDDGRLRHDIKEAMRARPPAAVERALTLRMEKTMGTRARE